MLLHNQSSHLSFHALRLPDNKAHYMNELYTLATCNLGVTL